MYVVYDSFITHLFITRSILRSQSWDTSRNMIIAYWRDQSVIVKNGWRLKVIFKNLKITANDVPNFVIKGMKCQN